MFFVNGRSCAHAHELEWRAVYAPIAMIRPITGTRALDAADEMMRGMYPLHATRDPWVRVGSERN